MKSFKQYFSLISSLLFMVACTSSQPAANKPSPFEKNQQHLIRINNMIASFQTPTTAIEVLKNIKLAFEDGWLGQDKFYTEENIKLFFGCNKVSFEQDNQYFFQASDCNFAPNLYIRGGKQIKNQSVSITLHNHISVPELTTQERKPWIIGSPQPPIPPRPETTDDLHLTKLKEVFGQQWHGTNTIPSDPSDATYFYSYSMITKASKNLKVLFNFSRLDDLTFASFEEQM